MYPPRELPEIRLGPGASGSSLEPRQGRIEAFEDATTSPWPYESATVPGQRYWRSICRHKLVLLVASGMGLTAGILWNHYQPRVYRSRATFEVWRVNEDFLNMRAVVPSIPEMDLMRPDYDVRTQSELLQSQAVLERVLGDLDLQQRLRRELPSPPAIRWLGSFRNPSVSQIPFQEQALAEILRRVTVKTRSSARIIELTFDARDPHLAADFANAILEQFVQVNLEERWRTSQRTTEWLTQQLHDLKGKLEASESQLQNYATTWNLIFADEKDNVEGQRLKQLQEELLKARSEVASRQARYELASSAPADSLPEVLDDPTLKDYRTTLTAVRKELAELRSALTLEHPKVIRVMAQESELIAALEKAQTNIVARIHNEYEEARRRESLLAADYAKQVEQFSGQADKVARYNRLRREVDSDRELYDSLFHRVKEAGLAAALPTSNIRIVDPAKPPLIPYRPNLPVNSALGVVFGLTAGLGIVLMLQQSEKGFRNPGEVVGYLRLCQLGVIPSRSKESLVRTLRHLGVLSRLAPSRPEPELPSLTEPDADIAESCRIALPTLLFPLQNGSTGRVIVVSSAEPGDGKTTVCSGLATALSKAGCRVLLIDGDTRRPKVHECFGIDNSKGLTDLLAGKARIPCREAKVASLKILPAGNGADPDLIFSPRLPDIIDTCRAKFDIILVDTPPVLHAPDARIWAHHADGAILVVRAHRTDRDAARLACELLEADGVCILGTILNDCKAKDYRGYGYYGYCSSYGPKGSDRAKN